MFEGLYFEFHKAWTFLFVFLACEALCKLRERGFYFPHVRDFAAVTVTPALWLWMLKWLSIALLLTALMSPVKEETWQPVGLPGHALALVVDASASMRDGTFDAADRTRSRFESVQEILGDFIAKRGSDTLGLVVFGTHAFVAAPLTPDRSLLGEIVERLYVGIAGEYTALYEAIGKAVAMLSHSDSETKIAVVLSDGRNTPGAPVSAEVAEALAEKEGVRIYAIVLGSRGDPALERIAVRTGGRYYRAEDAETLSSVYGEIDALERSPQKPPSLVVKQYYYVYPLFAGFLSLLLYVYLRNRRAL